MVMDFDYYIQNFNLCLRVDPNRLIIKVFNK